VYAYDAYAGTSIGAVLAMALAMGMAEYVSAEWFRKWMPRVFAPPSIWRRLNPRVSQYDDAELNSALRDIFGDLPFSRCRAPTFVTAVDVQRARFKVFCSVDDCDGAILARDVARRAVAAETYFEAWQGYADGGIMANNPSMVALAGCMRQLWWQPKDIALISLGTGAYAPAKADIMPHGQATTALWAIDVLLNCDEMHDYFAQSMGPWLWDCLRIQFKRQPKASGWRMDNPAMVDAALTAWDREIDGAAIAVREVCDGRSN
jgi:hypothetical protein